MKKGILLAAFGSGTPQGQSTLRLFDERVRALFPGVPVRWAFTSVVMRNRLAAARKKTDSVQKALRKMWFEKYTHVAVQSLHSIPGAEYADLLADVEEMRATAGRKEGFMRATVGAPLLDSDDDIRRAAAALLTHLPPERIPGDACVFMGHGTWHEGESRYGVLSAQVRERDPLVHIGTMDGDCTIDDILPRLAEDGVRRVWLLPLLSVVGRHAVQDMAGDAPDSWRSRIVAAGMECVPVLRGTAEYGGFVDIWLDHLGVALRALDADEDGEADGDVSGAGDAAFR
ncbi:sirohydrochlorin cobaltochelatase [Desulfovibrio oxamicus]|uniref:Sirohydrochlorin cobaltochelatase n=1 Tax=Nitratidesulfovibrio oxamicus TaxID=32016 RepID=A0ABS0J4U9_9BACT|nr:sirohydrochlorin cobaltochelatase [Nitratidesulfovibrio oxamicus]MBG3877457.1 sirohydrochlorin cobaltochelatase [Nitratidesulfovibrio oxamicus]